MCILFSAVNKHEQYPIIIATNRDEFIARETIPANYHLFEQAKHIYGGKDNQGGGTWLGIDVERGRFSCVLNVAPPETMPKGSPSRGALPLQYLVANDTQTPKKLIEDLLNGEEGEKRKYAGFTLLAADCLKNKKTQFVVGTNSYRQKKGACKLWDISDDNGIFGLTNDGILLRTYSSRDNDNNNNKDDDNKIKYWNKANRGCEILNKILIDEQLNNSNNNNNNKSMENLAEKLLETLLHNKEIDESKFHGTNPIFLPWTNYCTRTSQVILFEKEANTLHFFSRNYSNETEYAKTYEKFLIMEKEENEKGTGNVENICAML